MLWLAKNTVPPALVVIDELPAVLAICLLLLQLHSEPRHARTGGAPQSLQLEVDERMHRNLGIAEILFEHLHVFLGACCRGFLIANLLEQLQALVLQPRQLLLELGAIPEQLQQALVLLGLTSPGQQLTNVAQS